MQGSKVISAAVFAALGVAVHADPPAAPSGHVVLTPGKSIAPDAEISGAVELKTASFVLRLSAEARPVSLRTLADGKERLQIRQQQEGFYLQCVSGKIYFARMTRRGDGRLVFKTANETQQVVVAVEERPKYLVLRLEELIGIPAACAFSLHFGLDADPSVRSFGLDYMTTADRGFPVHWHWLWHRDPRDPLGAFAIYHKTSDEDEDDTLLRLWVAEGLPHPKVQERWDLDRARRWVKQWIETFSDTSVLWYSVPENEEELAVLVPYLKRADIREVHLMPWTWASGRHHCEPNPRFFKQGREGFRAYARRLSEHGIRTTIHYDFCGIPFDDPIYVGSSPRRDLARWGTGRLAAATDARETTVLFRPDPGVELPFSLDPFFYRVNPPGLALASQFNVVRIGDELIKVGAYKDTSTGTWRLTGCQRGLGSTRPAAHAANEPVTGLVAMFGVLLVPQINSPLFNEMTNDLSRLMNDCGLSHAEYDGVNPAYLANAQWMYRKYLGQVYSGLDHPVTIGSGYGEAPPWGYFEYELNAVRKLQGHELGPRGDIGARIRTHHLSRPASTVDEAQFRMSQVAAFGNRSFPLFFEVHYPSKWREYGRLGEVCDLIAGWKEASRRMTEAQREQIRGTLRPPNTRGHHSDIVWRLRKSPKPGFAIAPSKNPLRREHGDISWGCGGGEMGYLTPVQYIKPGEPLKVENPYAAQPPQFTIQVMTAVDYDNRENVSLQPELNALTNPSETQVTEDGGALVFRAANPLDQKRDFHAPDSLYPAWQRKVDMREHRAIGAWVTGDRSGAVLVLRLPGNRDYVVPIDFEGRRYVEIPNGEAYWTNPAWGGLGRCDATRWEYQPEWFKLGFGALPPHTTVRVGIAGLKALKERPAALRNPTIHVDGGRLLIQGTIESEQYLEYDGGLAAIVYDRNWNKLSELPVKTENYVMPKGWHTLKVTSDEPASRPWLAVRFVTEGDPMVIP
jgi:hypothetical protein